MFDSHCHVADPEFDSDRETVLLKAKEAGLRGVVSIGTDLESSRRAVELASNRRLPVRVWATVGLHPHESGSFTPDLLDRLERITRDAGPGTVVAVGETGLDFYYKHAAAEAQERAFRAQIVLARRLSLPLVIHSRDAWEKTFAILEEERVSNGVLHCFTGGPDEAEQGLSLGLFLSFSGIITFPKSEKIAQAARLAPLDRILIETDSPYLAPAGYRGKRNEPARVVEVARALAGIRQIPFESLAEATAVNTSRLFRFNGMA